MKRKELEGLEIPEEAIDEVMKLHGKGIEQFKSQVAEKEARALELDAQLAEAAKTIEGFKGLNIEEVQKSAEEWKVKAEKTQMESDARIKTLLFDHAIDGALTSAKAKNTTAVRALLNVEEIELAKDGETLVGLDKQLEAIKTDNDYLFESGEPKQRAVGDSKSKTVLTDAFTVALMEGAGLDKK